MSKRVVTSMTGGPVGSAAMSVDVLGSTIDGTWRALMGARRLTRQGRTSHAARAAALVVAGIRGWGRLVTRRC